MERMIRGGIARLSSSVEQELRRRDTGLHIPHTKGLADLQPLFCTAAVSIV